MIKVLDSFIADKIAAGEVIENPVSIVKELLENSIDAEADSLIIEIRNGGKSYIRVTDNGRGIPSEEIEIAFERHSTSKISTLGDLDNIRTLGFRGEALASIAAVSRLTIVSRTADSAVAAKLVMFGGQIISRENIGSNKGTTLVVEDVFYNTPARRKFMRSDAREASAILELVQSYAVYYTNIRFMVISNGETLMSTPGNGNLSDTVTAVFPGKAYKHLIPVESDTVTGLISDAGTTSDNRKDQLFFVNGRLVNSKIIEKAVEAGYQGRIFSGFPIAILFINADPRETDVNIHPGKKEIKFLYPDKIRDAVICAVSEVMAEKEAIPRFKKSESYYTKPETKQIKMTIGENVRDFLSELRRDDRSDSNAKANNTAQDISFIGDNDNDTASQSSDLGEFIINDHSLPVQPSDISEFAIDTAMIQIEEPKSTPFDLRELAYKGYIFNTYIVLEAADEIYLIDQHAAHERIYYEKLVGAYNSSDKKMQPVIRPLVINVSPSVYCGPRNWLDSLMKMGYDISDFGKDSFIIKAIPAYMTLSEAERFAVSFAENSDEYGDNQKVIDKLITRSCKAAVKASDSLSELEIAELIDKLAKCVNPFCCPHGRPTFIKISKYEIERSFKRK